MYPIEAGFVDTTGPLRRAIKEKAGRYGDLDLPYVIAVLVEHPHIDEEDLVNSLYGSIAVQVPVSAMGRGQPRLVRQRDGVWMGNRPRNTRVSAVVTVINLGPAFVARLQPTFWPNPWAVRPTRSRMPFKRIDFDESTGIVTTTPATKTSGDLFGLPAAWPGPERAFPR
jgi:hypothetical protein